MAPPGGDRGEKAQRQEEAEDQFAAYEQSCPGVRAADDDSTQERVIRCFEEPEGPTLDRRVGRSEEIAAIEGPCVVVLAIIEECPADYEARQEQDPGRGR
jgi:hypothetical protein